MSASFFSEKDPFVHFQNLFQEAQKLIPKDPNAMQIATVDSLGQPSVRTVLMKGIDQGGFTFFTNYQSPKSQNIENNQKVALNFYWPELNTQVRVIGIAQKVSSQESDNYFSVRPRLSQLGACTTTNSCVTARSIRSFSKCF